MSSQNSNSLNLLEQFTESEIRQLRDYFAETTIIAWQYHDYCRGCQTIIPFQDHKNYLEFNCVKCKRFQCPQCFPIYADFSGKHYIFDEWPYHIGFHCLICIKEAVDEVRAKCYLPDELWDIIYDEVFEKYGDECYIEM